MSELQHPKKLGKYRIEKVLGKGGMGVVYKAYDTSIDRFVAIKTIHIDLLKREDKAVWLQRFQHEVRAAGRCMHPNIVAVFDYGEDQGTPYIVMEYVEGKELYDHLMDGTRFSPNSALQIIKQVILALDCAHRGGVIHRDIKPSNIILLKNGQVKVTDFGIAHISSLVKSEDMVLGTPGYMAPEQLTTTKVDHTVDIYATAIVLFELLVGKKPFTANSMEEFTLQVLNEPPMHLDELMPLELKPIINLALAKNPKERYPDALAFFAAVEQAMTKPSQWDNQPDNDAVWSDAAGDVIVGHDEFDIPYDQSVATTGAEAPDTTDAESDDETKAEKFHEKVLHYCGIGLPHRSLTLDFNVLSVGRRRKPMLLWKIIHNGLLEVEKEPWQLLLKTEKYLKDLNRYRLSPKKRLKLLNICLSFFYPTATDLCKKYRKGGIPDSPERQKLLDKSAAITNLLVNGFKLIFQHDYELPNWRYGRARRRVEFCAFRILELIKFEQYLLALRYRQLSTQSWKDCNAIYFIMLFYENVEKKQAIIKSDTTEKNIERTLQELYISIQMFGVLDNFSWPTEQLSFMEAYIRSLKPAISTTIDKSNIWPDDALIVYYNQTRPPFFQRQKHVSGPAILIFIESLRKKVRDDYINTVQHHQLNDKKLLPQILGQLRPSEHLPVLNLMWLKSSSDFWDTAPRKKRYQVSLHIYVGFKTSYEVLGHIFYPNIYSKEKLNFHEELAKRSAIFAKDDEAVTESLWYVLGESDREIHLQTQETNYTTRMEVNSFVVFYITKEGKKQITLGFVRYFCRIRPGVVNIVIDKQATQVEPVVIAMIPEKPQKSPNKEIQTEPSILFRTVDKQYKLLMPYNDKYKKDTKLLVIRGDKKTPIRLSKISYPSPEILIYDCEPVKLKKATPSMAA